MAVPMIRLESIHTRTKEREKDMYIYSIKPFGPFFCVCESLFYPSSIEGEDLPAVYNSRQNEMQRENILILSEEI